MNVAGTEHHLSPPTHTSTSLRRCMVLYGCTFATFAKPRRRGAAAPSHDPLSRKLPEIFLPAY